MTAALPRPGSTAGEVEACPRADGRSSFVVQRTLDRMIGRDGFACLGRLTLADCALVPALSYVQHMLLNRGLADPIAANVNVAAYQAAIQGQEPAARVLAEFHRAREERREQISTGELEKMRAANQAAREAAERAPSA